MVFDRALPSSGGLIVEFDQAQYGGSGADGIGFFLSDGSRSLTEAGATGGALGYGQKAVTGEPGVAGGYLGVGLDAFGNFIGDFDGLGAGCATRSPFTSRVANTVTLRGPGDGLNGYCFLTTTATAPSGPSTLPGSLRVASPPTTDAAFRNVRVTVSPGLFPTVTVELDFTGTRTAYQTVLTYAMTDPAPATYKFGFSASTGDLTDAHLIRNVLISSVADLGAVNLIKQVDQTTPQPPSYALGDTIPYQFVVTNTGVEALNDVAVTDPIIDDITCPRDSLGPAGGADSSMVCTGSYVVTANDALQPTLTNTAAVAAVTSGGDPVGDTSSTTVDIVVANADLALTKVATLDDLNGNGLADPGETIAYSFRLTNVGNVTLNTPTVDDPFVGAVTCPALIVPGDTVTCTADADYTVTETDILAGGVTNTATATATPPPGIPPVDPPTDTVTTPTPAPGTGLALTKIATLNDVNGNGLADIGETVDYSFELTNTGNLTLTSPAVTDTLAGTVTCPAQITPGETVTCTADTPYTVTEADILAGQVPNTATADATVPDGAEPIDPPTDTVTTPTTPAAGALNLEKIATLNDLNGNGLADAGETIDYSFKLTNTGTVTLTEAAVTDTLVGNVTCPAPALAPGASQTCTADTSYTVTEDDVLAGGVRNTATGAATTPDGVPPIDPPEDTLITPTPIAEAGLSLIKTASLDDTNENGVADIGESITYTFELTNTGNVSLTEVGVDDPFVGTVTCTPTALAVGETATCTTDTPHTVTEADLLAGNVTNTATGTATPPPNVGLIPPTDTTVTPTAPATAALDIIKDATIDDLNGNGLADIGETVTFSFDVRNTGTVTISDITVDDPFAGTVSCPASSLAGGATMTCTADAPYIVTEADLLAGGIVNTATALGTPPPGVEPIDPPTDTITVPTPPATAGLALTKIATLNDLDGNGLADLGETITFTFLVTNTGTTTVSAVAVTDPRAGTVSCPSPTLAGGAAMTCTADNAYPVTESDILLGDVINTATAAGTPPEGLDPIDPPTDTTTTPTAFPVSALTLVKTAALRDANGNGLADAGETIIYSFLITNIGNVTVVDVAVTDPMLTGVTCPTTTLPPSAEVTCQAAPYVVTAADTVTGNLVNTATATGAPPDGVLPPTPPTSTVSTPTNPVPDAPSPGPSVDTGGTLTPWTAAWAGILISLAALLLTILLTTAHRRTAHR